MTHGGGSRRSGTPATKLSRRAVPRPVLHLFPLRPWTSLLQHHLPRKGQPATTAIRQYAPPTKPGRPARSPRPATGVSASMPSTTSPRDGSRDGSGFPFDHFPGIIRMWNIGCSRCRKNNPPRQSAPFGRLRCCICGHIGRFIDPFPHIPRRRWLPS